MGIERVYSHNYLHSKNGPQMSKKLILNHIKALHKDLIRAITAYFRGQYRITIYDEDIIQALIPAEAKVPFNGDNSENDEYSRWIVEMRVQFQDVVDQIFLRLDGRGLTEQAFYEVWKNCQYAAYRQNNRNEARFERKKDMISFKEDFCAWRNWPYNSWQIFDRTKDLLKGIAHFETGSFGKYPDGLSELIGWQETKANEFEFPFCVKLKQVKLFKNGRVDVRFTSAAFAEAFVATYLAGA